jgi:hypothetical protein
MTRPLCVDLFCGLGGWTEGFLAEGYQVIGFDIEQHVYGEHRYPAQLVIQDVCTLHGSQFRDASIIVASSPCQEFSYRAMPWKRAKALGPPELGMHLFSQAARIQREACEAAGRYIPMVQENVKGAQPYAGRARWHYGSYYLWGDVPALMPFTTREVKWGKHGLHGTAAQRRAAGSPGGWWTSDDSQAATKNCGGSWFSEGARVGTVRRADPRDEAMKQGGDWFRQPGISAHGSKSTARKAASARIAKIPFPLARHIAHVYHPDRLVEVAS